MFDIDVTNTLRRALEAKLQLNATRDDNIEECVQILEELIADKICEFRNNGDI